MHARTRTIAILAVALVIAATAAACTSSGGSLTITGAWARESMAMADTGAAYLVIENTTSETDFLLGGSTPAAATIEVHETVDMSSVMPAESMAGDTESASPDAVASMSSGGMLGMQKIDRLEIPAGGSVELKPGSYHLMLIDLTEELKAGDLIEMTLDFEKAGSVKVTAEVREG